MRRPLLQRIADETGALLHPATMRTLPDDIALSKRGVTVVNQMDLWDMPAVLVFSSGCSAPNGVPAASGAGMNSPAARVARHVLALLFGAAAVAQSQKQLVIVSGIGGDPRYTQAFGQLSSALAQAANERAGLSDSAIVWFGEAGALAPAGTAAFHARQHRAHPRSSRRPQGDRRANCRRVDRHGSGEGADTRISLPGADLTAADFAKCSRRSEAAESRS